MHIRTTMWHLNRGLYSAQIKHQHWISSGVWAEHCIKYQLSKLYVAYTRINASRAHFCDSFALRLAFRHFQMIYIIHRNNTHNSHQLPLVQWRFLFSFIHLSHCHRTHSILQRVCHIWNMHLPISTLCSVRSPFGDSVALCLALFPPSFDFISIRQVFIRCSPFIWLPWNRDLRCAAQGWLAYQ